MKSRITAMALQVHRGLPAIRKPFELNELRRQRRNDVAVSPLARIPDRFSQHGVKLALAEFLRLPPYCLPRHLLCHRAGTGGQQRRPSPRERPYLGFCCWRLLSTLQAQTSQPAADRVTATPETARDLRGTLSYGPEFFEPRYVFRIPTHGRYYNADCQLQA